VSASSGSVIPTWLLSAGLICAFGLWFSWAPLVVLLQQAQPQLPASTLFALLASTGLSGLCLRLTLGFLTRSGDEPLVFAASQLLLVLSALGFYLLLGQGSPDLRALQGLALLSGVGGGCFSVLVYGPKTPGDSLRIDFASSLGQLGIVISFVFLPALVLLPLPFSSPSSLSVASSHVLGRVSAGESIWLAWFGLFWGLPSLACLLLAWPYVRRQPHFYMASVKRFVRALAMGLALALPGCWWLYAIGGVEDNWSLVPELTVVALLVLLVMGFWLGFRWTGRQAQLRIFYSKHTWAMSLLWVASLGSFLGYAMVLPLVISRLFWDEGVALKAEDPGVFMYAWMLPLAAALMRPLGSWCVYRWGGAVVTHACLAALTLSALWAAYQLNAIQVAAYPLPLFAGLLLAFAALFIASGLTHATLICRLPKLFPMTQWRGLGIWFSAIAVVGVVYLPLVLGDHLMAAEPSHALLGSAIFYGLCLLLSMVCYTH